MAKKKRGHTRAVKEVLRKYQDFCVRSGSIPVLLIALPEDKDSEDTHVLTFGHMTRDQMLLVLEMASQVIADKSNLILPANDPPRPNLRPGDSPFRPRY